MTPGRCENHKMGLSGAIQSAHSTLISRAYPHAREDKAQSREIFAHKHYLSAQIFTRSSPYTFACLSSARQIHEKSPLPRAPGGPFESGGKKKSTFGILPERDSRGILRSNVTISIAYLLHKVWDLFFRLPKDPVPFPFLPIVFYAQILK